MYHGGTNPTGKLTTLNEAQANNEYNDLPAMTYDFQAPLGEFGQVRPHYHLLRRLHMFLHDWGEQLATMRAVFPRERPVDGKDAMTLRCSIRTDGGSGFLFVSNYQRLLSMPEKHNVQFEIHLPELPPMRVPLDPVSIPADTSFSWPFNLDLAGAKLLYATAQPIARLEHADTSYFIFTQIDSMPVEFVLDPTGVTVEGTTGSANTSDGRIRITGIKPGTSAAAQLRSSSGRRICIIVLDEPTSLTCWKMRDRILLTRANLLAGDGPELRLRTSDPKDLSIAILPATNGDNDGVFRTMRLPPTKIEPLKATFEQLQPTGGPRQIKIGSHNVAEQPTEADFDHAAAWRIKLPTAIDPARNLTLRIHYLGDVARVYLDGKLLTDNFYNGDEFDVGLKRFASAGIYSKELVLKVLPMPKDAPIYLSHVRPPDGARLESVELIEEFESVLRIDE
jgi:hypothetical protein